MHSVIHEQYSYLDILWNESGFLLNVIKMQPLESIFALLEKKNSMSSTQHIFRSFSTPYTFPQKKIVAAGAKNLPGIEPFIRCLSFLFIFYLMEHPRWLYLDEVLPAEILCSKVWSLVDHGRAIVSLYCHLRFLLSILRLNDPGECRDRHYRQDHFNFKWGR